MTELNKIDDIITETRTRGSKKQQSPAKKIYTFGEFVARLNLKKRIENNKMARLWTLRNLEFGSAVAETLELSHFIFQQNIYVEESKELVEKLKRLGFVVHTEYPDEKYYKPFSKTMYMQKYNISLSLYKPQDREAIVTAFNIVPSKLEGAVALAVFLSAITELMKK